MIGVMADSVYARRIVGLRQNLQSARANREQVWNDCWRIYRGAADWSDKQDWQAKIFLPKAWNAVEQAVSLTNRYLAAAKEPWFIQPYDESDPLANARASVLTSILRVMLDKARFQEYLSDGLRIGFITGLGIWKVWWGLEPHASVEARATPTVTGTGVQLTREVVRTETLDGRLFIRPVDPNNFYWLPGSRLNQWTGTIEDMEVPRWELEALLPPELTAKLGTGRIDPARKAESVRFGTTPHTPPIPTVKITEYYGPLFDEQDRVIDPYGHIVLANDTVELIVESNPFWDRRPPYIGFTPIPYPLRLDGVGLIENIRDLVTNLNEIVNLSVDSLLYRLLPIFEVYPQAYENSADLKKILKPGLVLRRSQVVSGTPGISSVQFSDVSGSAISVAATLDRAIQEGSLISEILQSLPRYRGVQTATEIAIKNESQNNFFGFLATQVEENAIKPILEMVISRIIQFLPTSTDPRIAAALGLPSLAAVSREELVAMVQGPFTVHVGGITEYIKKTEQLGNLVQLMNILGQNQTWLQYIRPDQLLRSILEAFRPSIEGIDQIVASPEEIAAAQQRTIDQTLINNIPTILQSTSQSQPS